MIGDKIESFTKERGALVKLGDFCFVGVEILPTFESLVGQVGEGKGGPARAKFGREKNHFF